ncbi:MAG TPA: hypothetical protein VIW45_18685 [Vicinamibacterales bacterium]|jgi:hypothetical protein
MRRSLLLLALLTLAAALHADEATLTLVKTGGCSGSITVTDVDTHRTLASCGVTCAQRSVSVPAGTWVRVSTQAAASCSGGLKETTFHCANRFGACMVQVEPEGTIITAGFAWQWRSTATPYAH